MDPAIADTIVGSPYGRLYNPEQFVMGSGGAANNWGKGRYSEGADLAQEALNVVRKASESCDCLQVS